MNLSEVINQIEISHGGIESVKYKVDKEITLHKKNIKAFNTVVQEGIVELFKLYTFESNTNDNLIKSNINILFAQAVAFELNKDASYESCKEYIKKYCYVRITNSGFIPKKECKQLEAITDTIDDAYHYHDTKDFSSYAPEGLKELLENMRLWCTNITEFKYWDSAFNIESFADSLMLTGKHIKTFGNTVNSKNKARTAYRIAGALKKAYNDDGVSASVSYCMDKKYKMAKEKGVSYFEYDITDIPTLAKIYKLASDKEDKRYTESMFDVWKYLSRPSGKYKDQPLINQIFD